MKELQIRILVAVFGIPLFVFTVLKGELYFFALIALISALGQWELYDLLKHKDAIAQRFAGILLGFALLVTVYFGFNTWTSASILLLLLIIFCLEMFFNKGSANLNVSATLFALVYPTLFLASIVYLRQNVADILPAGNQNPSGMFVLTMIVSVWACDTFAYVFGKQFGKHRLFERVSPKKSIEGAIAGLAGAVFVFFLVGWVGLLKLPVSLALISGLIVGTVGQLGDLVESWFKRDANVKDSSKLLPGHGGILDRFDSLSFISPAFLILFLLWR